MTIYPELLTSINLTDNGINDHDLSKVIRGLTKLISLKKIVIKNNFFNSKSCEALSEILAKTVPNNLEELRLISNRTGSCITSQLCDSLMSHCFLRKLALIQAELSDQNVTKLCQVIKNARFLIELDISNNRILPFYMQKLSSAIADNRQLQVINFSLNFFTSWSSMKDYMMGIAELDQQNSSEEDKEQQA